MILFYWTARVNWVGRSSVARSARCGAVVCQHRGAAAFTGTLAAAPQPVSDTVWAGLDAAQSISWLCVCVCCRVAAARWEADSEARLRAHAARLKADTVALRATQPEPSLFSYHGTVRCSRGGQRGAVRYGRVRCISSASCIRWSSRSCQRWH